MSAPQQPGYNAPVQGKSRVTVGLVGLAYSAFLIACLVMFFMGKWIYEKDANGVPTV